MNLLQGVGTDEKNKDVYGCKTRLERSVNSVSLRYEI